MNIMDLKDLQKYLQLNGNKIMVSKECIKTIVSLLHEELIRNFAVLAIEHLKRVYPYSDNVIDNALQLIVGVAEPYTIDSIDMEKVKNHVKTNCYKAENAENIKVVGIDSIALEIDVEYKKPDDNYTNRCTIDIMSVLKD